MTESPEDDIPLVELGVRRDAQGSYVQARRPGDARHAEYGPMPDEQVAPFIEALKRTVARMEAATAEAKLEDLLKAASEQVTKPN